MAAPQQHHGGTTHFHNPKEQFCDQFAFLLWSGGICENSGFVDMKHKV